MAFHTKKDFAKMCGIPPKNLATYIGRGKVITSGEYINDQLQENIDFLNLRMSVNESKKIEQAEVAPTKIVESILVPEVPVKKIEPAPNIVHPKRKNPAPLIKAPDTGDGTVYSANLKKAQVSLSKVEIETKIKELEYAKLLGKNIPTEHVKVVITQLGKSFATNYKDGADSFLTEIGHRAKITPNKMAELKSLLVEIINRSHEKAIETAKAAVKNIIDEEH